MKHQAILKTLCLTWCLSLAVSCTTPGPKSGAGAGTSAASVELVEAGYPVMQGVTGPTWARLTVLRSKSEVLNYKFLRPDGSALQATNLRQSTHEFAASDTVVDEITVQGLKPSEVMNFQIEKAGQIVDQRRFSSRPGGKKLRFAVTSCSDDSYRSEQQKMWSHLLSEKPDFIFAIGDNVYADWADGKYQGDASPDLIWRRYVETRRTLALFRARDLVPVIATWDDHDFGQNDGDRRFKHQKASEQIFKSFFPQTVDRDLFFQGPGVASGFGWGEQRFILLDGRSFRSPNRPAVICDQKNESKHCAPRPRLDRGPDPMGKKEPETHFGKKQTRWAMKQIDSAGSDVIWLFSGDQWFGNYSPFESFEGNHPTDFRQFLKELKDLDARVAFVSGDRHSSEFTLVDSSYLGYETFEVVSSPIHARVFPSNWIEFPNPRQQAGVAEAFNYTVIDSEVVNQKWNIQVRNFKLDSKSGSLAPGYAKDFVIERPMAE